MTQNLDRFIQRVWIKDRQEMWYDPQIKKYQKVIVVWDWDGESDIDDCILMQSTGLKDKNGNLIFEGDIVTSKNKRYIFIISYGLFTENGTHTSHSQHFGFYFLNTAEEKESFSLRSIKGIACYYPEYCLDNHINREASAVEIFGVEKIGNIYENRELLNK